MIVVRKMDREADRAAVEAIEPSFETSSVFDVVVTERRIELVERPLPRPLVRQYPMADAFAFWASWDVGFVAEDERGIAGFAAVEYEAWHSRLVLWHLYVTTVRRRQGFGRALLQHVEAYGRSLGARRVWLETTSHNVPGVAAYASLGYAFCGADTTQYQGLYEEGEAALFLSKRI